MIPNVFISSTIADLHYLRDALREAVEDLSYRPVMSDYAEVSYIAQATAVDSCYRSVQQCQLMVLLIGCRYGSVDKDGLSITHREFLTAQEARIPIITFIEQKVISFKQVYDADPQAAIWTKFQEMDNPKSTFALIDQIRSSPQSNGMIPFTNAGDAKKALKTQVADFVGNRLAELVPAVRNEVQNVLAEIKALRSELEKAGTAKSSPEITRNVAAFRFLLDDRFANFKHFLERLYGDIDPAIPVLINRSDIISIVEGAGGKMVNGSSLEQAQEVFRNAREVGLLGGYQSGDGSLYWITKDRKVYVSPSLLAEFQNNLAILKAKINAIG